MKAISNWNSTLACGSFLTTPRLAAARRDSAERLQRLILEELHHRVKNTLAIVQSITDQSLRTAVDLPQAGKGEAISMVGGTGSGS